MPTEWNPPASRKKVAGANGGGKKPTPTQNLAEALDHIERLVSLHIEWQTDWSAVAPERDGVPNPDFDPAYVDRLKSHPEDVYDPAVLAARAFVKRVRPD